MIVFELKKFGPIISDKAVGEEIFEKVNSFLMSNGKVIIDFNGVRSMATYNAKQVFGRLYLKLGSEVFFEKIEIKNASDDIKIIIKMGIQHAIFDNKNI